MPKSMTGYGMGASDGDAYAIRVECRSVNHRYLDVSVRMPSILFAYEPLIRSLVQAQATRGRVEVRVTVEGGSASTRTVTLDRALATSYRRALEALESEIGERAADPVGLIARQSGVLTVDETVADEASLEEALTEAVNEAMEALNAARAVEGQHLAEDLLSKADELARLKDDVMARAPDVPKLYRERLLLRAEELFEDRRPEWYDDQRLFAETAVFADRASIDEEVTRLGAHIEALKAALVADDAVGRQLDFLLQEIVREVNTIGSKANDLDITQHVVAMKTIVEQIREQVQNLE